MNSNQYLWISVCSVSIVCTVWQRLKNLVQIQNKRGCQGGVPISFHLDCRFTSQILIGCLARSGIKPERTGSFSFCIWCKLRTLFSRTLVATKQIADLTIIHTTTPQRGSRCSPRNSFLFSITLTVSKSVSNWKCVQGVKIWRILDLYYKLSMPRAK